MSKLKIPLLIVIILALGGSIYLGWTIKQRREGIEAKLNDTVAALYPQAAEEVKGKPIEDKIEIFDRNVKATQKTLADTQNTLKTTQDTLAATQKTLEETKNQLAQTQDELAKTQKDLADTKGLLAQAEADRDRLTNEVAAAEKSIKELLPFKAQFEECQAKLAELPKQLEETQKQVAALETEKGLLDGKIQALEARIVELTTIPPDLAGNVLLADPQWGFVVLSVGREDRIQEGTEFFVYRDSKVQGKVRVTVVDQNVSVADVIGIEPPMTGVHRGPLKKMPIEQGDKIVYAPAK